MNQFYVKKFTEALYELMCCKNLTLQQSLQILGDIGTEENSNKKISYSAKQILELMSDGLSFSAALTECKYIKFDMSYINCFCYSEITGNLTEVIKFLKDRCDEESESFNCFISASVYPGIVILLGITISLILFSYRDHFGYMNSNILGKQQLKSFFKSLLVFMVLFISCFSILVRNLKEDKKYEAFLIISFLLKSGMNMYGAFSYAAIMLGEKSRYGKLFVQARNRISMGMDLRSAFDNGESKKLNIPGFETAIYFAQKGGSKSDVFEKIAASIRNKDLKKRKLCLRLIEPLLIGITGMFLILLVINFVMPVMMNTDVIL